MKAQVHLAMLPVVDSQTAVLERPRGVLELTAEELQTWLRERGQPPLRARQIRRWILVAGAESFEAMTDLPKALRTLDEWRPDLMLSDMGLRGDDGYVLIRAVRALPAERGGCLRAAALTAGGEPQMASRAVAAGYDAELAKPVEPVALLATVARLVQPAGV